MEAKTRKSEMTRASIVDAALSVAAERGLTAVTMKSVADKLTLSKSGVFSRAGSSEALQLAVVEEYGRRFVADIFLPAMQHPRGLARLDAMMTRWFERIRLLNGFGASVYEAAAFNLTTTDDPLKAALRNGVLSWRASVRRTLVQAVEEKQLVADADLDLLVYAIHALLLGALYDQVFLQEGASTGRGFKAYTRLIASYRTP